MKSEQLTELVIVMVVIGILIAVAIPGFRGMQEEVNKLKEKDIERDVLLIPVPYDPMK